MTQYDFLFYAICIFPFVGGLTLYAIGYVVDQASGRFFSKFFRACRIHFKRWIAK